MAQEENLRPTHFSPEEIARDNYEWIMMNKFQKFMSRWHALMITAGLIALCHFSPENPPIKEKLENIEVYEMTGVNNTNKKYFISCDYVRDHTIKESHGPRKYPVYHYEFMSDSTNTTDLLTRLKAYKPVRYRKLREEF